jgi:hypothetical protein
MVSHRSRKERDIVNSRYASLRVLLVRVDHANEPCHDEVDEANAASEVLGIEQLNLDGVHVRVPLLLASLKVERVSFSPSWADEGVATHLETVQLRLSSGLSRCLRFREKVSASRFSAAASELETYSSPSRISLDVGNLPLLMTDALAVALVLLDRVHDADVEVGTAEEEDLGNEVWHWRCGCEEEGSGVSSRG